MKNSAIFQQLSQTVTQLYTQSTGSTERKIYAKFDRTLFSEDFQSFAFYFEQIQQTLEQLARLNEQDGELISFLSEKLSAQCTALSEATKAENAIKPKSAVNFKPILSEREKRKQEIHRLPPRERLVKYYDALQALNEKIIRQENLYESDENPHHKATCALQLETTRQRRKRCLEAIELLEEYLAFKEN
ncbi:MAG TPA: primosomal replication protein PriB/PriC [Pasteurellaceae bacterium]|nr:primosomal replication protein PriB/PriC [Pasteurellaceae bacterium]